jgi:hypothetical protein
MGIKPAVYCIQKSNINEKIILECEKNKSLHQRSSSTKEATNFNVPNEKTCPSTKKLVTIKSAVNIDSKYISSTTPLKKELSNLTSNHKNSNHVIENYYSNNEKKKDILLNFSKSKRTNSEDLKEITVTNATILTQEHEEKGENGK